MVAVQYSLWILWTSTCPEYTPALTNPHFGCCETFPTRKPNASRFRCRYALQASACSSSKKNVRRKLIEITCQTERVSKLPSRELTYPTWGKGKSSSKCHFWGDMLVPWRVTLNSFAINIIEIFKRRQHPNVMFCLNTPTSNIHLGNQLSRNSP